jgi:hypothetical protein
VKDLLRQALNVIFAVAQIAVSVWAGDKIGNISDQYPTLVVPAGYAFAIWSIIFALSLGYAIYQALPSRRESPLLRAVGWFTASAFLANSVWMAIFPRYLFVLSVAVILWILVSLVLAVVAMAKVDPRPSGVDYWLVYVTINLFLGWITIATVANVAQTLVALEWNGWGVGPVAWAVVVLLLAGAIASTVVAVTRGNLPYAVAVVWALAAVVVKQLPSETAVAVVAGVAALAVISSAVLSTLRTANSRG